MSSLSAEAGEGLRERHKARLRRRILATAVELFRERGYEKTVLGEVAERLEVSPATVYNYFPGKDAVLAHVAAELFDAGRRLLEAELARPQPTAHRLRHFLSALAAAAESDRALWRVLAESNAMNPTVRPDLRSADATLFRCVEAVFADGQRRRELSRRAPPELLAQMFEGIYVMILLEWALEVHAPHSLHERLDRALDVFLQGVRTRSASRRSRSRRA